MANGGNEHTKHGVGEYIAVALILGIITYVEFAIVEYEIGWLGDAATLWVLMILSAVKFVMVILFFMHLKDDDVTYSGFFGSGMVMGLGTFVAFAFLMTAPSSLSFVRSQLAPEGQYDHGETEEEGHGGDGLDERTVALIESDGYARELSSVLADPRPKDLTWSVEPPAAQSDGWTVAAAASAAGAGPDEAQAEREATAEGPAAPAAQAAVDAWDEELGQQVFGANCASCHQANGQGIPGAFPPLAGHVPELLAPDGGRTYLVDALLYGLQGQIAVSGQTYNGVMPAWGHLSDEQIAAVVNYVSHEWDNAADLPDDFAPIQADDVAAERGKGLAGSDVHDLRGELALGTERTTSDETPSEEPEPTDAAPTEDAASDETSSDTVDEAETDGEDAPEAQAAADAWDEELGQQVFGANCASCHQANGQGIPGAFPPLAGHVPELLAPDGGRTYLVDALLYGLQGQIAVSGQTYNGVMPAWGHLSDEQIAAVVNYVSHEWDNAADLPDDFAPIQADDVAAERGKGLAGSDVHDLRGQLALP